MKSWMLLAPLVLVAGCQTGSRQPEILSAGIAPPQLSPGDTAVISVALEDEFAIVQRVEGVVKEDTSLTFKLKDDGVPPDEKAADGIWTIQVDVPFNAPPGDFEFSIIAYDSDGEPILIRDENGDVVPLTAAFGLVIAIPAPTPPEPE